MTVFGGQAGAFFLALANTAIIARALGPEGKGLYSIVVVVVNTVVILTHGSLSSANSHFTGRKPQWAAAIFGNSVTFAVIAGTTVAYFGYIYSDPLIDRFYPQADPALVKMALAVVPLLFFYEYMMAIVLGRDRLGRYSAIIVLKELVLFGALLIVTPTLGLTVRSAVMIWIFTNIAISLFAMWSAWSGVSFTFRIRWSVFRAMLKYSAQSHVANLTPFLRRKVADILILGRYSVSSAGYYSIVTFIVTGLSWLPTAIQRVLIPYVSRRGDEAGNQLTPMLSRIAFAFTAVVALIVAVFGWWGIYVIFGVDFLPAYMPLLIRLPGSIFYSLAGSLAGDLGGRGMPQFAMRISLLVAVINISVNLILIPRYGLLGAAITTSLSDVLAGLFFLKAYLKVSGVSLSETILLQRSDFRKLGELIQNRIRSL